MTSSSITASLFPRRTMPGHAKSAERLSRIMANNTFDERSRRSWKYPAIYKIVLCCLACLSVNLFGTALAQEPLNPGEAIVTKFAGSTEQEGKIVIDTDGATVSIIDLRRPGIPPQGQHLFNELHRGVASAGQVGQVFGIAIDDATPANIYLTATSAFGLHRNTDNSDWMAGMWGEGGGPGTVWKLDGANNYQPEVFAHITSDGRQNSGAALGNIAFDRQNQQLFVSDLETGLIHRLRISDGAQLGTFDHGVDGRASFLDPTDKRFRSLPPVTFDPDTGAKTEDCPSGDFARTPSCWNLADFRRRVWGIGIRSDAATRDVRLYYAVWSSQGFGTPEFAAANMEEKRNTLWSVRIGSDGDFDLLDVRREFTLPDFFRSPEAISRAGFSHPVSDIAFPQASEQNVMLLAERGGVRNLGLAAENGFAHPHESRVLRYELTPDQFWREAGRYDVGFYDRGEAGPPYLRAGSAGGVSFGMGYQANWEVDGGQPDDFAWLTGDGLCSRRGQCFDPVSGANNDSSEVSGLQGRGSRPYEAFQPITAFQPYPSPGPATPPTGAGNSFMIDTDANIDAVGNLLEEERSKNDATRIGDVEVFQILPAVGEFPQPTSPELSHWPEGLQEEGWVPAPAPPDGWFLPPPFPLDTDLAIRKAGPAQCQEGVECSYTITIRNVGGASYIGPLAVSDAMPVDATLASTSPGWNCIPVGSNFSCITNAAVLLPPGAIAAIEVNILLPADVPGPNVQNCAAIDWFEMGTDDGVGDGNDDDCVTTPVIDGFDLALVKDGSADCVEGGTCGFEISIINHGPGDYDGVIAVRDQLPPNSELVGQSPGWSCLQSGDELECRSISGWTLPALGTAPLDLLVKLPDGIAGGVVENCAEINWSAMGADDGTPDLHADDDCHTVNVLDKTGYFDLSISKTGPASCDAGANCNYTITVTNEGPDVYNGAIYIREDMPAGAAFVSASAGWTCGGAVDCFLNGPPHLLNPGDSRSLDFTITMPAASDFNCVEIVWGAGGMPLDDDPGPGGSDLADSFCVVTLVDEGFDMSLAKNGPAACFEGAVCEYTVDLTNEGPNMVMGVLAFDDILPDGASLESVEDAWACVEGAPGTVSCNLVGFGFPSGFTHSMTYRVRLPDPVIGPTVENCVLMNWGALPGGLIRSSFSGDDNVANDGPVCTTTPVLAADLAPWGATTCALGKSCPIEVRVENRGGRLFSGAAGLRGTLEPAVAISSIESLTPGFNCSIEGAGIYQCESSQLRIEANSAVEVSMVLDIPQDFPHPRIIHRKEMIWPDVDVKDAKPENDRHTSAIMIVEPEEPDVAEGPDKPEVTPEPVQPTLPPLPTVRQADLSVSKTTRQSTCFAGGRCDFQITVSNVGSTPYRGQIVLNDVTTPSSRLLSSGPRPWRCRGSRGQYSCTHPVVSLAPGQSRALSVSISPRPGNATGLRNCVSLAWSDTSQVMAVQDALNELGFSAGTVDGKIGPRTRNAIRSFQERAGLPATGQVDGTLLDRLFGSWDSGDANAANDNSCATVRVQQRQEPPPVCARGQEEIAPSRVSRLQAQGWQVQRLTRGGITIFCGTPPAPEVTPPVAPPPLTLRCPPGYKAYLNKNRIPRNSEVARRKLGDVTYYCARPRPQARTCPGGWQQVTRKRAKTLARRGWEIQQIGELLCARPRRTVQPSQPSQPSTPNCSGGRVWDAKRNACVCPGNLVWNPKQNRCVRRLQIIPQLRKQLPRGLQ